jgi:DNA-binding MarR family transcriptional regulator
MTDAARAAHTIANECLCTRVRRASRALTKLYDDALRGTGIQTSQLTLLVTVAMFGEAGAGIHALADALIMDRTTLSRNLRPLERLGHLRVARAPGDGRRRIVLLTREGERTLAAAFPRWQRAQERLESLVGEGGTDELRAGADHVVTRLVNAKTEAEA